MVMECRQERPMDDGSMQMESQWIFQGDAKSNCIMLPNIRHKTGATMTTDHHKDQAHQRLEFRSTKPPMQSLTEPQAMEAPLALRMRGR